MDLSFSENLSGYVYPGESNEQDGYIKGKEKHLECSVNGTIEIPDVPDFITITERSAKFDGTVTVPGLGEKLTIINGVFNCYRIDENKSKDRLEKIMEYKLHFRSETDEPYYFHGKKHLYDDKTIDMLKDSTTMYAHIYKGDKDDESKLYASGILKISADGFLKMVVSTRVTGTDKLAEKIQGLSAFYDFFFGEAYDIYFQKLGFFYSTDYQNFVLSGKCNVDGKEKGFFFYSGAHDIGFPWGTDKTFWDVSFVIYEKNKNGEYQYEKYLTARQELYDNLKLNVVDKGTSQYSYKGTMYRLKTGYAVSFSDDLMKADKSNILEPVEADISFEFNAIIPKQNNKEIPGVIVPFGIKEGLENAFLIWFDKLVEKYAPETRGLGVKLGIRSTELKNASVKIANKTIEVIKEKTWGEAESSTIKYVKEPTLDYQYFCGISPEDKNVLVHTSGGVLFDDTIYPVKNIFDFVYSKLAAPFKSVEVNVTDNKMQKIDRKPKKLKIKNDYILEVNFDHYELGVFQRRIVLINDHKGNDIAALEEDVKRINLSRIEPVNPVHTDSPLDLEEASVAVFKSTLNWPEKWQDPYEDRPGILDNALAFFNLNKKHIKNQEPINEREARENEDKIELLHKVCQATNFIGKLYERAKKLNKKPSELKVVIKPNFMFLYDRYDQTTYTSPVLVRQLVDIIYDEGFTDITVVEAQSTYGNFFENRGVVNVAKYIDLESCEKYKVIDLSDQKNWIDPEKPFKGPLKPMEIDGKMNYTKVPKVWQDADFRISFAKNKTHCYAYYTLCIKCIYGSLPVQNKYHEYHCNRGIYGSTIEWILHYPIHFGFVDAYVSSDGIFGVFANKTPNYTRTIIGGENIIAVDWIGGSKMGLDPILSQFMKLAVKQFGKPRIRLLGDTKNEIYKPWVNVPIEGEYSMNHFVDKSYQFGNAFTEAMMSTDTKAFPLKKESWWMKTIRFFDAPTRAMVFGNHKILKKAYGDGPFAPVNESAYKDIEFDTLN